ESECLALEANIRWAEAFILILPGASKDGITDVPVVLVGNKIDQVEDRMVSLEEGQRRSKEIGCVCFHEISVRENIEQVWSVFRDVCRFWRVQNKNPSRLRRSGSEKEPMSPDSIRLLCSAAVSPSNLLPNCRSTGIFSRRWTEVELEEEKEENESKESSASSPSDSVPFRERASTDGHLQQRPWRWRYPPVSSTNSSENQEFYSSRAERRMSISMRGNNASY
ncbi:ras-like protein 3, partial [Asbolus verrucosus]